MKALGASEQLKAAGARNGDLIMVGAVDFSYFEESPMTARARLAGFGDDEYAFDDASGFVEDDSFATPEEEEARNLAKQLDKELMDLLDGEGEVLTF